MNATMPNPPNYTSGLGETIRAHRLYMGLSREAMAAHLGMADRSYARIESNQRDCPPGLIDTLHAMADRFDADVVAARSCDQLELSQDADEWTRAVAGRAAVESGRILHSAE